MTALAGVVPTILAAGGEGVARTLLEIGGVLLALGLMARLANRIGLSPIPLFLMTGLLLRDGGLFDLTATDEFIEVGAEIGVVLLLLMLGLEYTPQELMGALRASAGAGAVDLVLNFLPGLAFGLVLGWSPLAAVFLGGITYISSSGIIAKVLGDLGRLGNRETPTVLAILVIEDLVMAVYLPIVAGLAVGGAFSSMVIGVVVAMAVVALALFLSVRHTDVLGRLIFARSNEVLLFSILGLALVIAGAAEALQVSAAVGAFLVGIAVSGPSAHRGAELLAPLRDLFAGVFFVFFTFTIEPSAILRALPIALALAVVTAATKMFTGWWAANRAGIGVRGRVRAGTVLVARGEFSIVIATLATTNAVEPDIGALATAYVLILAVVGPVLTRYADPLTMRFAGSRTRTGSA
ncbi:cation:proton antiporter [Rhabdothermincola salaria]|uniref:cation:proton antiporter n=1 Tax=Rhabdothermincola salaria TaxID=2903142 RepID=UPI001E2E0811|nr:cation:proton antiporter [Rhabdothermincola salaria]